MCLTSLPQSHCHLRMGRATMCRPWGRTIQASPPLPRISPWPAYYPLACPQGLHITSSPWDTYLLSLQRPLQLIVVAVLILTSKLFPCPQSELWVLVAPQCLHQRPGAWGLGGGGGGGAVKRAIGKHTTHTTRAAKSQPCVR